MKKVRCGGQPLTADPRLDINLVLCMSFCAFMHGSLQLWIGKLCCYVKYKQSNYVPYYTRSISHSHACDYR